MNNIEEESSYDRVYSERKKNERLYVFFLDGGWHYGKQYSSFPYTWYEDEVVGLSYNVHH